MKLEQVEKVAGEYEQELTRRGYKPVRHSEVPFPSTRQALEHGAWMCGEIRRLAAEQEAEKAMRWLGFAQALLWTAGVRPISAMRDDNRDG